MGERGATVVSAEGASVELALVGDRVTLDLSEFGRAPIVGSLLIVADAHGWAEETSTYLSSEGFDVTVDRMGRLVHEAIATDADALLIDLELSAASGPELCRAWRARTSAPILAVARATDEATVLSAFAAGVDAFCPISIPQRLLLARLRSVLRRFPIGRQETHELPSDLTVMLDDVTAAAVVLGSRVSLTEPEFAVLRMLLLRAGRVVAREELLDAVRTPGSRFSDRSLDFVVRRVREKLEAVDTERRITTVRGVGFRFELGTDGGSVPQTRS